MPSASRWIDLGGDHRLGINADGEWVMSTRSGNYALKQHQDYYRLLILLERPAADVFEIINNYRASIGVSLDFFLELVVQAGLVSGMDYWADLALKWLPYLSLVRRRQLENALRDLASSKWAKQRTRQRAKQELLSL